MDDSRGSGREDPGPGGPRSTRGDSKSQSSNQRAACSKPGVPGRGSLGWGTHSRAGGDDERFGSRFPGNYAQKAQRWRRVCSGRCVLRALRTGDPHIGPCTSPPHRLCPCIQWHLGPRPRILPAGSCTLARPGRSIPPSRAGGLLPPLRGPGAPADLRKLRSSCSSSRSSGASAGSAPLMAGATNQGMRVGAGSAGTRPLKALAGPSPCPPGRQPIRRRREGAARAHWPKDTGGLTI